MKKLIFPILLIGAALIFFSSCKDKTTLDDFTLDFGYEYFPIEIGKYKEYLVDSTIYDFGEGGVTIKLNSTTYVKEEVTDTIIDNLGRLAYKIERSERLDPADSWEVKDVWMTIRTATQAESLEENLRFIRLIFPLKKGGVWNGNRFIDETTNIAFAGETVEVFKAWEYEVSFVGEPVAVNNEFFEEAVEIVQADNENLIELRYSKEQYVKNIGLAYREMKILDTQCIEDCIGQTWEEKAEKGFILTQTLIGYN